MIGKKVLHLDFGKNSSAYQNKDWLKKKRNPNLKKFNKVSNQIIKH